MAFLEEWGGEPTRKYGVWGSRQALTTGNKNGKVRGATGAAPLRCAAKEIQLMKVKFAGTRLVWLAFVLVLPCAAWAQDSQAKLPYLDPSLTPEQRAKDIVSRMTLEEKVSQMQNVAVAIPRLGIPAYDWWNEALHGDARAGLATVFPQAIGLAATWDTDLMHRIADTISTEARAKYNEAMRNDDHSRYHGLTFWSPNINIFRDPRWGRGQETYGEDPFLTSRMGVAFVEGMQGNDPHYLKTVSTAKHFAVHSGPEPLRHEVRRQAQRARPRGNLSPGVSRHHRRRQSGFGDVRVQQR